MSPRILPVRLISSRSGSPWTTLNPGGRAFVVISAPPSSVALGAGVWAAYANLERAYPVIAVEHPDARQRRHRLDTSESYLRKGGAAIRLQPWRRWQGCNAFPAGRLTNV